MSALKITLDTFRLAVYIIYPHIYIFVWSLFFKVENISFSPSKCVPFYDKKIKINNFKKSKILVHLNTI